MRLELREATFHNADLLNSHSKLLVPVVPKNSCADTAFNRTTGPRKLNPGEAAAFGIDSILLTYKEIKCQNYSAARG